MQEFKLTEIDHVGIAVSDLTVAIEFYKNLFGAKVIHEEVIESDGVKEALIKVGDSYIQLLSPISDTSPVAKFLSTRGEGVHHIGYRVTDCDSALEQAKSLGIRVIDEKARPGSRGTLVGFIHPKSANGTLIELVQER